MWNLKVSKQEHRHGLTHEFWLNPVKLEAPSIVEAWIPSWPGNSLFRVHGLDYSIANPFFIPVCSLFFHFTRPIEYQTMPHRFHTNTILGLGAVEIQDEEMRHVVVARIRPGEPVVLFNGDGFDYCGVLVELGRREARFDITKIESNSRERSVCLIIGTPLPKGEREQFLIEKLVEIGVTEFVPLMTSRSTIHPEARRLERLRKHVIEASKQCGRSRLMAIRDLTPWGKFVSGKPADQPGWVAHPQESARKATESQRKGKGFAWGAIGPEGGLTDLELIQAQESGWSVMELGNRILRMETAAMILAWELGARTAHVNHD